MNIATTFPSKYLKAAEMEEDMTVTINHVAIESVGQGKDAEDKPVIYFDETDKGLVLNKTNSLTITKALGTPETDDWAGKQITLYPTEVEFAGETMMAIRVRLRTTAAKPTAAPKAPVTPPPGLEPDAPAQPPQDSARVTAYKTFLTKTTSMDEPTRKKKWLEAVAEKFPNKPQADMTAADWTFFTNEVKANYDEAVGGFLPF